MLASDASRVVAFLIIVRIESATILKHYLFTEVVMGNNQPRSSSSSSSSSSAKFVWKQVPRVYGTASPSDPCCAPLLGVPLDALLDQAKQNASPASGGDGGGDVHLPPRVAVRALDGGF